MDSYRCITTVVKFTKNPFFNFRTLFQHCSRTSGQRYNAISLSCVASCKWNKMSDRQKAPYRKLAEICRRDQRPLYLTIEVRVPAVGLATWQPITQKYCTTVGDLRQQRWSKSDSSQMTGCQTKQTPQSFIQETKVVSGGTTVTYISDIQPDLNFGGYETNTTVLSKACI